MSYSQTNFSSGRRVRHGARSRADLAHTHHDQAKTTANFGLRLPKWRVRVQVRGDVPPKCKINVPRDHLEICRVIDIGGSDEAGKE